VSNGLFLPLSDHVRRVLCRHDDLFRRSLGLSARDLHLRVILPVGISFYTFQSIRYIVDVYRGEIEPARNPVDFAVFVAFFPHMVAGPIMHSRDLLPQFQRKRHTTPLQARAGLWLILFGLFKKMVISDNLAPIVDRAFADATVSAAAIVFLGVYAFAFQIYCDFSGYSDIAREAPSTEEAARTALGR
jgi:alginate O-acetyltransferase complex protein AlgI